LNLANKKEIYIKIRPLSEESGLGIHKGYCRAAILISGNYPIRQRVGNLSHLNALYGIHIVCSTRLIICLLYLYDTPIREICKCEGWLERAYPVKKEYG
jgi:hypothetical protein